MGRTSCIMGGFCLLFLFMILLMRSGDVETNPGPDRSVTEEEFIQLSKVIDPRDYKQMGVNLRMSIEELDQIKKHRRNTSDAFITMFTRWRDKQPPGTDIRARLARGLERSDLWDLCDELRDGSLVPNTTDTTTPIPSSTKTITIPSTASNTTTHITAARATTHKGLPWFRAAVEGAREVLRGYNIASEGGFVWKEKTKPGLLPSTKDFDDILVAVAKRVRKDSEIDTLGKKLKLSPEDIQGYIETNHKTQNVTYDGTLQMLRDWRKGQTNSTEGGVLKTALEQSGQIHLADDLFPSSLLPSSKDFDDILVAVAKRVRKGSEIDTLGKKLKFSPEDIQGYIETNHKTQNVTNDGTLQMLRDWRKGQTNSTEGGVLKTALVDSGQIHLADDLFPSS